jgi:predicted ester cyclase
MSEATNRETMRRYYAEVWEKGNLAAMDEFISPAIVDHNPLPGMDGGYASHVAAVSMIVNAFGNPRYTFHTIVAEGDRVAGHWTMTATHTGELLGIPPTGKQITISGTDISRFEDGKIVDFWHVEDQLAMLTQLGVIPAAAGAS